MNLNYLCTHSLLPHGICILVLALAHLTSVMNICGSSWAWLPDQILSSETSLDPPYDDE